MKNVNSQSEVMEDGLGRMESEKEIRGGGRGGGFRKKSLGERELEIMRFCYEQVFLTRRQIRRWIQYQYKLKNEETARSVVIRSLRYLQDERLVEVVTIYNKKDAEAIRVTTKGLAVLQDNGAIAAHEITPTKFDSEQVKHDLLVTDIRIGWVGILPPRYFWCSERLLQTKNTDQIPDAMLTLFSDSTKGVVKIAIEVERFQKSSARYEKKFRDYEAGTAYDLVYYFSANAEITKAIHEVSRGLSNVIFVSQIDEFLKFGSEARMVSHSDHYQIQERISCVKRS